MEYDVIVAGAGPAGSTAARERAEVREVEVGRSSIQVRAGNQCFRARSLVAADGANGPTAKLAGLPVKRWKAVALEANITPPSNFPRDWTSTFAVDVGSVAGGYGWLFPKGEHVNVGLGGGNGNGPTLRKDIWSGTRMGNSPRLVAISESWSEGFWPSFGWRFRCGISFMWRRGSGQDY